MIKQALLIILIILFCFPTWGNAQVEDKQNLGTWLSYKNRAKINSRFYYVDDISFRYTLFHDKWQRYSYTPVIVFNATNEIEFYFGIGNHFIVQDLISNTYELRIWQGAKISWPNIKRVDLDHFFRFEKRNIYEFDSKKWDTGYRARYRLSLTVPLNNMAIVENTFYTRVDAEAYSNIGHSITEKYIDQARFSATLGYRKNLKWTFELMYVVDDSKELAEDNFELNNHIIRFRIINIISL